MKLINEAGQAVYFNAVTKNGKEQYIIKAISGQKIPDRDRRRDFLYRNPACHWCIHHQHCDGPIAAKPGYYSRSSCPDKGKGFKHKYAECRFCRDRQNCK